MVPTFGFQPFDRVGVQLCPCNLATACAADLHRSLPVGYIYQPKSSPHIIVCGCTLLRGPDPPGSSRWVFEKRSDAGSSRTPFRLTCRTRTIWQY